MKNLQNNLPPISIIIPCRNEEEFISGCLDSMIRQDYPKDKIEILAIDGASNDKTKKVVRKYIKNYPFIKLLNNVKKITPIALNIGIRNSTSNIIIRIDSHAKYNKNYISKCVSTLTEYNADNVGGVIKTISKKNNITSNSIIKCLCSSFGVGDSSFRTGTRKIVKADTVPFGCFKREIFNKIGLFNEKLVRSQDIEFNIRLKKAGGKIILNPEIVSYYYPKSTLKEFFKHNFVDGVWTVYPVKITNIPLKLRHYIPLLFILSLLGTITLSIFWKLFLWFFLFILGLYLMTSLYFSMKITFKEKNIKYLFLMPITFVCRHFGYGLGSFWGILTICKIKK